MDLKISGSRRYCSDRQAVRNFSQRVEKARPPMELRYMREVADDHGLDWEYTERVLSSRDLDEWMRQGLVTKVPALRFAMAFHLLPAAAQTMRHCNPSSAFRHGHPGFR